jgi:hypothetical protein
MRTPSGSPVTQQRKFTCCRSYQFSISAEKNFSEKFSNKNFRTNSPAVDHINSQFRPKKFFWRNFRTKIFRQIFEQKIFGQIHLLSIGSILNFGQKIFFGEIFKQKFSDKFTCCRSDRFSISAEKKFSDKFSNKNFRTNSPAVDRINSPFRPKKKFLDKFSSHSKGTKNGGKK